MSEDTPLWAPALNALLGVVLLGWAFLTMGPFILGMEPLLPGMEFAFIAMCAWAGWNSRLILRRLP
jgi:hypothetical protein